MFHSHCIVAKLQLIQIHDLFHHLIHLAGFIHNDFTVKLSALLIVIDVVHQALCISLDQSDRRLQLMGYIGQELFTHSIDLFLLLKILLQLRIGLFQFCQRLFQRLRQHIHAISENTDFILCLHFVFGREIQFRHSLCNIRQHSDRPQKAIADKIHHHKPDKRGNQGNI